MINVPPYELGGGFVRVTPWTNLLSHSVWINKEDSPALGIFVHTCHWSPIFRCFVLKKGRQETGKTDQLVVPSNYPALGEYRFTLAILPAGSQLAGPRFGAELEPGPVELRIHNATLSGAMFRHDQFPFISPFIAADQNDDIRVLFDRSRFS